MLFCELITTHVMHILQKVELVCPSQYGQTVASELFRVPVSVRRMKRLQSHATASMHILRR